MPSSYDNISISSHDMVAVLAFNRPDSLNAINPALLNDLRAAIDELNGDTTLRAVILTGEGRAFGAGADLAQDMGSGVDVENMLNNEYKPALMAITDAPVPWISAINGAAAGISSAFAMACDLTIMAEDAYIYQAFSAIGLIPDGGATWHLAQTVGRKRAYEIIISGEKLSAEKCLQLGLCNRVVAPDQLMPAALEWARELTAKAPLSLRYAKHAVNTAMRDNLANTISEEARLQNICISSDDFREGVSAFMQKRPATWKGDV